MKPKLTIATVNDYVLYQPTLLNLYDELSKDFDVCIISFEPKYITREKDLTRNVEYLKVNRFVGNLINKIDFVLYKITAFVNRFFPRIKYNYLYYNKLLPFVLKKRLKKLSTSVVIAVDIIALHIAQEVFGKVHFLSLEIDKTEPHFRKINPGLILSVLIQHQKRFQYLFQNQEIPTFIVQNAPPYDGTEFSVSGRSDFLWAGTIIEKFAVLDLLNFFEKFSQYRLVLKGGGESSTIEKIETKFSKLLSSGQIVFDRKYLSSDEFISYIAKFRIGFCFYGWDLINSNYNYKTAPSGKLFMYMAAGVPVIACNIPGFDFIDEFGAGILIDDYEPETIKFAIERIESDYETFSRACYKVAENFDFKKSIIPYRNYLLKNIKS